MSYNDLYMAIWRLAVKDEENNAITRVCYHGNIAAYNVYAGKVDEPLDIADKRFMTIKKDIRDYAQLKSEPLKDRIKELVYKETKEWPDNGRGLRKDKRYNDLLQDLTDKTVAFAAERMAKRWNKI